MSGPEYDVHGGAHDIEAGVEDMAAVGRLIGATGVDVGAIAVSAHGFLVDANLLSSVFLSPGSFAKAEAALIDALDGRGGLTWNAAEVTAAGLVLQGSSAAWEAFDAAQEGLENLRQQVRGRVFIGLLSTPATGIPTLLAGGGYFVASGGLDDPQRFLVEHPGLLEEIVGSSPPLLDLLIPGEGFPANVEQASGILALLYDQGPARIERSGVDPSHDENGEPLNFSPTGITGALGKLDRIGGSSFQVERVWTGDAWVYNVYLPGTETFDGPLGLQSPLVRSLGTNLAGVAGADNTYEDAVLRALADLQLPPDAQLNLVGHSQGGIIAARLAEKLTDPGSGYPQYDVRTVLTAGSPVDHIALPEQVQMVSLANEYDIVPRLDGEGYDDHSNHTSIVFESQMGTVGQNHSVSETYQPFAAHLEDVRNGDEEIDTALANLDPYFTGDPATTFTYQMERG